MEAPYIEFPERFNIASAMVDGKVNEGEGDKVAFCWRERNFNYKDIQNMVNKIGNALKAFFSSPRWHYH